MMAEGRVERRLAAILAADVAGYSRLVGVDEEGTLAALKAHRGELIDPNIGAHHGRIAMRSLQPDSQRGAGHAVLAMASKVGTRDWSRDLPL
jgi:class 3 adenylate cyclase